MTMLQKIVLGCVTVATLGVGLALAVTGAEAHHFRGYPSNGFGLFFSPPGVLDNCHYDDGYYDDGNYDNGYYGGYHHGRRHVSYSCNIGGVRIHYRLHGARICNGHATRYIDPRSEVGKWY